LPFCPAVDNHFDAAKTDLAALQGVFSVRRTCSALAFAGGFFLDIRPAKKYNGI
jgi:hypothetical protein